MSDLEFYIYEFFNTKTIEEIMECFSVSKNTAVRYKERIDNFRNLKIDSLIKCKDFMISYEASRLREEVIASIDDYEIGSRPYQIIRELITTNQTRLITILNIKQGIK
jgi:hypothetical protein